MKKSYIKPQTADINVNFESVIMSGSIKVDKDTVADGVQFSDSKDWSENNNYWE